MSDIAMSYITMSNWEKDKMKNNDPQNITLKPKDWASQTPINTGVNTGALEW